MSAKICKITIIIAIAALFFGCPGYNELDTHPQDSENGFLTINIGDSNENRTILPKNANINCNTFSLVLTKLGRRIEKDWTGGTVSIELSPGSWDLTLIGYSDASRQNIMVNGSANGIVVGQSQTTSHTVYLQPAMVFDRTGTFIWNINYPYDVTSASMVITPLNTSNGSPQQTINFSDGALKNNNSSPLTLKTGYYKVTFSMTGGIRGIGRVDYLHIYDGLESYFSYDFTYGPQFENSIEMVRIEPGIYTRGQDGVATPSHQVILTNGFYMGKYEVTQEQYQAVMGVNPSSFTGSPASGEVQEGRPVDSVTWYDAVEFCNKLSEREELTPVYTITGRNPSSGYPIVSATVTVNWNANGYRLPTEAEWEYACRAGTTTVYNTGDTLSNNTGWYVDNSGSKTHEAGLKPPNAWGLYDMHGNVWEWCWDWYASYSSGAQTDPIGAASGSYRIYRGGGWDSPTVHVRSANRGGNYAPSGRYYAIGFRVVRLSGSVMASYTVTYNGNANTGGTAPADNSSPYYNGSTVTVLNNTGNLVKTGYTYAGWNTQANGSGTSYAAGAVFTVNASTVLYAQWKPIVIYNGNNNTGGTVPVDSNSPYTNGAAVTVLGNTGNLVKTGYTFAGWNTNANGSGTSYAAGAAFTINAYTVLYAQWTPVYTITYNGNTNTGGAVPADNSSPYYIDSTVTVLSNTGNLVKTGYTFAGWNTQANGNGTSYAAGAVFTVNANTVLYAQWTSVYTITYNGNTSTSGTVPVDSKSPYINGAAVTVLGNTGNLFKTGYTFAGWNTQANGSGTSYAAGAALTINDYTVLYAQWTFMEMILINPGTYTRGSNNSDDYEASPPHQVTLTKGYYMGKYVVTQEQYQAVTGVNPSRFTSNPASGEVQVRRPVETVTWYDAVEFCNKLSEQEGLMSVYTITGRNPTSGYPITSATVVVNWNANGYRLPTEAEWEYACRAGTTTAYNTGEIISDNTGWYQHNSSYITHEVGLKSPNTWGLYDMHGNVSEWCWDWQGSYTSGAQTDPRGAASGFGRVLRGGSLEGNTQNLRSASRDHLFPSLGDYPFGFRVVRN